MCGRVFLIILCTNHYTQQAWKPCSLEDTLLIDTMAPKVEGREDLDLLYEAHETATGKFIRTGFAAFTDDDTVYFGELPTRKLQITWDQYSAALRPIPDSHLFPTLPSDYELTVAPEAPKGTFYVKRPHLFFYRDYRDDDVLSIFPELLLGEAKVMEAIAQHPHPNIIGYHGCRVFRNRVTGIVINRYEHEIYEYLKTDIGTIDNAAFMDALQAAIHHLHDIGFAHNDINPRNIMVGEGGIPVLIDFGSCRRVGEKLGRSRGTPGWVDEVDDYTTSEARHDTFALKKIGEWLDNPTFEM